MSGIDFLNSKPAQNFKNSLRNFRVQSLSLNFGDFLRMAWTVQLHIEGDHLPLNMLQRVSDGVDSLGLQTNA